MICFHFIIFVLLGTAKAPVSLRLWVVICFHFIIFVLLGTADHLPTRSPISCDLLSFHYLCIRNSSTSKKMLVDGVVICFHFIIFVLLGTARQEKQGIKDGCDLLSFAYICCNQVGFI